MAEEIVSSTENVEENANKDWDKFLTKILDNNDISQMWVYILTESFNKLETLTNVVKKLAMKEESPIIEKFKCNGSITRWQHIVKVSNISGKDLTNTLDVKIKQKILEKKKEA